MTRAHYVRKARKAIPGAGIKPGDSYWWWKFKNSPRQVSKTQPKRSQLTRSEFLGSMYELEDQAAAIDPQQPREDIAAELREIANQVEELGQEQSDKRDNMPYQLQDADSGTLLQERADQCETIAQALNEAADELENDPDQDAADVISMVDWSYD